MCCLSVMYVKLNTTMTQTWLSGTTAKASSCVRDLMAKPGSLKGGGQQSSDLLARSARSFSFFFSCSITLLVQMLYLEIVAVKNTFNNLLCWFIILILLIIFEPQIMIKQQLADIFGVSVCYVGFCLLSSIWTVTYCISFHKSVGNCVLL